VRSIAPRPVQPARSRRIDDLRRRFDPLVRAGRIPDAPERAISPAQLSASALRATTLCVLNQQRAAHGVRPLRRGAKLVTAAKRHSRAMVARKFFAHDSLSGAGFSQRIARTGWMRGAQRLVRR
jgi:uncharacterized protein YkwD